MRKIIYSHFSIVILAIFLSRIGVVLYSVFYLINAEDGERVSPLRALVGAGDHGFYVKFTEDPWGPLQTLFQIRDFDKLKIWITDGMYPGPIFPWLLKVTMYDNGYPVYLSLLYLGVGIVTCIIWAIYLRKLGATVIEQLIVICYPLGIYYTLLVSTDLIYCLFVGSLYILLTSEIRWSCKGLLSVFSILFLCFLTRPNSLALILVFVCYVWSNRLKASFLSFFITSIIFLSASFAASVYYLPYFFLFHSSSVEITYWNIPQKNYISGIFNDLPKIINVILSWVTLFISKLFYLVGLRPSYSEVSADIVLLRAAGGVIMLPGIFYIILYRTLSERLFLLFFITPIMLGASQERYILPLYPILMYYGVRFWKSFFYSFFNRVKISGIPP